MMKLPEQESSFWRESYPASKYTKLDKNIRTDVVIVGGGITGLTCAYLLKKSGLNVAVLEKNTIGSGTTGGTTGKVTSQHNLIYEDLIKQLGEKHARNYATAYESAIGQIEHVIQQEKIDCEWERADNYVFTTDPGNLKKVKAETKAAVLLGLPASFETNLPLPFEILGAMKFTDQAKFNAQKYVLGLAAAVNGSGSSVFEHSNVTSIRDGEPATVKANEATVTAKHIIVASKVPAWPLIARFSYGLLEYPHTSYIVAGRFAGKLPGMYISPDKNHYSILSVKSGKQELLLIGGEKHIPGLGRPIKRHNKLAEYAEKYFGLSSIDYRWKAMDYLAYDGVPLIGKVYPWSKHLYTATGFKKWGLSTSMVAGTILRDLIHGEPNPFADTFTTQRIKPVISIPNTMFKYFASKT